MSFLPDYLLDSLSHGFIDSLWNILMSIDQDEAFLFMFGAFFIPDLFTIPYMAIETYALPEFA